MVSVAGGMYEAPEGHRNWGSPRPLTGLYTMNPTEHSEKTRKSAKKVSIVVQTWGTGMTATWGEKLHQEPSLLSPLWG